MKHLALRHILIAIGAFLAVTIVGLWSWNTLAELFGGPEAQYRHVVAAAALLLTLRLLASSRRTRVRHRSNP